MGGLGGLEESFLEREGGKRERERKLFNGEEKVTDQTLSTFHRVWQLGYEILAYNWHPLERGLEKPNISNEH